MIVIVSSCWMLVDAVLELCSTALFGVRTRMAKKASQLAVLLAITLQIEAKLTGSH